MKYLLLILLNFMVFSIVYSQHKDVEVYHEKDRNKSGHYNFYARSNLPGKYTLMVNFKRLVNMRVNGSGKKYENTMHQGDRKIFSLRPEAEGRASSFNYSYSYEPGCKKTKHDKKAVYLLPFKKDKEVKTLGISYLGDKMGYDPPEDFYSIGFYISPGDTIYASRKGVVMRLNDKATTSGIKNVQFTRNKNYIIVQHKDCTMARYTDLGKEILVKPGETIYPGQPIAIADATDYINGDHIKFSVYYRKKNPKLKEGKETGEHHIYAYVTPSFLTEEGSNPLNKNVSYRVQHDEKIIQADMSKKEKKKYKKGELY